MSEAVSFCRQSSPEERMFWANSLLSLEGCLPVAHGIQSLRHTLAQAHSVPFVPKCQKPRSLAHKSTYTIPPTPQGKVFIASLKYGYCASRSRALTLLGLIGGVQPTSQALHEGRSSSFLSVSPGARPMEHHMLFRQLFRKLRP